MIVLIFIGVLVFAGCGSSGGGGDDSLVDSQKIDENIAALYHLDQIEPFDEQPSGDAVSKTYELEGRTYECSEQEYNVAAEYDEQLTLNPTTDILWPGAILDGATIDTGEYVPIVAARKPITISVSLVNIAGSKMRTVKDPKLSTMRNAIAEILGQDVTGATEARVTFEIVDVYSESQLDLAVGVTYKNGLNSVKNQFDFSNTEILSRTLVKFLQVYYTIDVDLPEKPSDLFDQSVSWETLDKHISGQVSPMYVSTISYGRMALFSLESTYSSTQVHNALQASIAAINTNVSVDMTHKSVLTESTMKATIIGGSGQQAVQAVNGFDGLKEYMTSGGNYDKNTAAAPLAYKMRYLSDNGTCRIVMAQNYVVKSCNELKAGHYGFQNKGIYVARFYVAYNLDGQTIILESGNLANPSKWSTAVPAKATDVLAHAQVKTGLVWDPWQTIFKIPASGGTPRPEVKCWEVSGTTLDTDYDEIPCDF